MSSQTTDNNKRLDYLDVAKGIGILLVIFGHCQLGWIGSVHSLIYSFHMPLFFFISGVCFSNKYTFSTLAVKRFRQIILPTIYFSIISTLLVDGLGLNVEWWDWSKHFPFALWFLPVLYFTELVAWLICNKIMSKVSYVIFLLALLFLPHFLSHFSVDLVYSIASIPIAAFFYLIGYSIKTIVRNFKSHLWGWCLLLAFLNVVIVRYGHVSMELASGHISPFIIAEIAAFAGIFSCLCLSKGLTYGGKYELKQILIWFGQNSLCLMLVHQLIKVVLDEFVLSFIDNHFIVMTLQICLTLVFSVLITIVVTNYIPFIIGKKSK